MENVAVTDKGPSDAAHVATTLLIPAGLKVTSAPGATIHSSTLNWLDPSLPSGDGVVYPVTFDVDAGFTGRATTGGVVVSDGHDPNPANNATIATIDLVSSEN